MRKRMSLYLQSISLSVSDNHGGNAHFQPIGLDFVHFNISYSQLFIHLACAPVVDSNPCRNVLDDFGLLRCRSRTRPRDRKDAAAFTEPPRTSPMQSGVAILPSHNNLGDSSTISQITIQKLLLLMCFKIS
ncbi:hypothetical protein PoB_006912600 [Plakobranchus ocellatus]|uniref:Uncharacterized protein n=1 Tax=Plakobranchus ocellatus TaxID=259542 RepID=A0AAV4DEN9_9GAST|nr:hypothetical protein PoB_006912600 [Plakobranchus ocellatus]